MNYGIRQEYLIEDNKKLVKTSLMMFILFAGFVFLTLFCLASVLMVGIIWSLFFFVLAIVTLFTLGAIWLSGNDVSWVSKSFSALSDYETLSSYVVLYGAPVFGVASIVFMVLSLVKNFEGMNIGIKHCKYRFVATLVITGVLLIGITIFLVSLFSNETNIRFIA